MATAALLMAAAIYSWSTVPAKAEIPVVSYSEVARALGDGRVRELVVADKGTRLIATLAVPTGSKGTITVSSTVPTGAVTLADLERWGSAGATVRVSRERVSETALQMGILVIGIGAVLLLLLMQRHGGRLRSSFGATPPSRMLTMADVGGVQEARADLRDVIAFLRDPQKFEVMGARCPKGVLLVGPPGTGKTLLARAVAGEAGCPVIVASGSDFNEMYVGVGAQRVRALAKQARSQAPCIVFIDEFDSIGGKRGRPNRSSEEETTLNQLLVEMDGTGGSEGVVWMAATNREDMLDQAVRRPGRFDRVVEVTLPTSADRREILRIHASRAPLAPDVDLERIAMLTVGHSGAELANLVNEAAIIAVHEDSAVITNDHFEQARDKILLGRVRAGVVVSAEERRLIAIHEAGHAVVGLVACPEDKLHKVTIEARGRSLGAAHFAPENDRHLHTRRYLEGVIAKALGGRAAEMHFIGHDGVTTGAGSDLAQATSVARQMVSVYGMSEEVGLVSADGSAQGGPPSEQLAAAIDRATRDLISRQMQRAMEIVVAHEGAVEAIADALLTREILAADEVHEIAARYGVGLAAVKAGPAYVLDASLAHR
jgi:cell division protease FtsH